MSRLHLCLTRSDLPSLQLTDIPVRPQTGSKRPRPQSLYVHRVQTAIPALNPSGLLHQKTVTGLGAYILDRVEPGADKQSRALLDPVEIAVGDTLTVGSVTFTAVAADPDPAVQEVLAGDVVVDVVASIKAAVNHADTKALFVARNGGVFVTGGGGAGVELEARKGVVAATGSEGSLPLAFTGTGWGVDATTVALGTLYRQFNSWFDTDNGVPLINIVVNAIVARLDAGESLTTTYLNNSVFGPYGTGIGVGASTATLTELLDVLAGRGYQISRASGPFVIRFASRWNSAVQGGFKKDVGGVPQEVLPIVTLVATDEILNSLATGSLSKFTQPTNTLRVQTSTVKVRNPQFQDDLPPIPNCRLVAVYDDNGNVVA